MKRLLLVAVALMGSTACVRATIRLDLSGDGSGTMNASAEVLPNTSALLRFVRERNLSGAVPLPTEATPEVARELRSHGVRRYRTEVDYDHDAIRVETSFRFDDLAAMRALPGMTGWGGMRLERADGAVALVADPPTLAPDPSEMKHSLETLPAEDQARLAELIGLSMGEATSIDLRMEVTVPGEVVSVGDRTSWVEDGHTVVSAMGEARPSTATTVPVTFGRTVFVPTRPIPDSAFGD